MGPFVARRLLQMLATVLIASFVFFSAVTLLPGDPVRALFGFRPPPPELYEAIQEEFHLDEPFWRQYILFVTDLVRGDLGHSYPADPYGDARQGPSVASILGATIPVSAILLCAAVVAQVLIGVMLALLAVLARRPITDLVLYAVAILLVSVPVIVSGYALQAFVGLNVDWLPYRWRDGAGWANYVLPVASLSAGFAAYLLLLARTELLATLRAPFMRTPVAFGIRRRRMVTLHAMRASLVPVITFLTANLGNLLVGLVVVESIFRVPGVGLTLFDALQTPDRVLTVILMIIILVLVIAANGLGDIISSLIDPRIRLEET